MAKYAIGLDYGTLSVRALLINIETGEEIGVSVYEYPHKVMDTKLSSGKALPPKWALQHPMDYLEGLVYTVSDVMKHSGVQPSDIVGIGVDFTASTVLPVKADGRPLCMMKEFEDEPHAYVKLWKHHGPQMEAEFIERIAKERGEEWLSCYGDTVSGEWLVPKVLETIHQAPQVYEQADYYIEAMDWIVWQMTGKVTRSMNARRIKAFYSHKSEEPSNEFFATLHPILDGFVETKMQGEEVKPGERAGTLSKDMAEQLGLLSGIPVGTPIIDANACVLGGGVMKPGEMMLIVGTSFCQCVFSENEGSTIPCANVAKDGVLPGYYFCEAGQSGGGDHFEWFVKNCIPESYEKEARDKGINIHALLTEKLEGYKVGSSGLLALDWFNGVRSPLADFDLNGMMIGMNFQTKPEEIYRALIEATAYGTRNIMEAYEEAGNSVDSLVMSGGIPLKNPMLVQVFSDVLNREIRVCPSTQAGALGAAMLGISAASSEVTGYQDLFEVVAKLGRRGDKVYKPNPQNVDIYNCLYHEYKTLYDYFGRGGNDVMKRLNKFRQ